MVYGSMKKRQKTSDYKGYCRKFLLRINEAPVYNVNDNHNIVYGVLFLVHKACRRGICTCNGEIGETDKREKKGTKE